MSRFTDEKSLIAVERNLLKDAGITVDDSIPFQLYYDTYPDVLAVPQDLRDVLLYGMIDDEDNALHVIALLFQRIKNKDQRSLPLATKALSSLMGFWDKMNQDSFLREVNYLQFSVAAQMSSDIKYVMGVIESYSSDMQTETIQLGNAAIDAFALGPFLRRGIPEYAQFLDAHKAAHRVLTGLRKQSVRVEPVPGSELPV